MANGKNAPKAKGSVPGDNEKARLAALEASHIKMKQYGADAAAGKSAKGKAIDCYRDDCLAGVANFAMVEQYVAWYEEGGKLTGGSRKAFKSALALFGDPKVVAAYPEFSKLVDDMYKAKTITRNGTDKDKFGNLSSIARRVIKEGAPLVWNEDYVKATCNTVPKSTEALADIARESMFDAAKTLLGDKPNEKLVAARDAFFKLLKIDEKAIVAKKEAAKKKD